MRHAHCSPRRRNAFTLIELLVVLVLILVIASVGLGYIVFGQDNQHSVNGAQAVTGALLNAKQRARRDGLPTGVRILFTSGTDVNGNLFNFGTQLQLIQQPNDYNAGVWSGVDPTGTILTFTGTDFQGGAAYAGEIDESTVQAGDYFVVAGAAQPLHQIIQVLSQTSLKLASSAGTITNIPYTIVRAPRRLPSEDFIQLPNNVVLDNSPVPPSTTTPTYCQGIPTRFLTDANHQAPNGVSVSEILFSPSGAVVGQGTQNDKIYLWLRDSSLKMRPNGGMTQVPGAPLILAVQIRTGLIGVYPVAPWTVGTGIGVGNDPYAYVRSARSSGL